MVKFLDFLNQLFQKGKILLLTSLETNFGSDQFTDLEPKREQFIIRARQTLLVCFEMVILAIMTTIAFKSQDLRASERVGPGLKKERWTSQRN